MNEENQRRRTRRRERPVKKKKGRILAICLAALVLAGAVYGVHTWADYSGSFQSSAEVTVKIPSGSSGRQIAAQLAEDGIISHKTVFYYYMRMTGAGAGLKPGSYVLRSDMSYAEIVEALSARQRAGRCGTGHLPGGSLPAGDRGSAGGKGCLPGR